jgi:hypothetical protein
LWTPLPQITPRVGLPPSRDRADAATTRDDGDDGVDVDRAGVRVGRRVVDAWAAAAYRWIDGFKERWQSR